MLLTLLNSTEFYVILFTVAALLVGLIVKPRDRGAAETSFATGTLTTEPDTTPRVEFECLANGDILLRRCGLTGLSADTTVALAITRIAFDVTIEERITPQPMPGAAPMRPNSQTSLQSGPFTTTLQGFPSGFNAAGEGPNAATFLLEGMAPERYHITYNSSAYSTFLSTNFTNRPGTAFAREFPA